MGAGFKQGGRENYTAAQPAGQFFKAIHDATDAQARTKLTPLLPSLSGRSTSQSLWNVAMSIHQVRLDIGHA